MSLAQMKSVQHLQSQKDELCVCFCACVLGGGVVVIRLIKSAPLMDEGTWRCPPPPP